MKNQEAYDALLKRRSVRSYTDEAVPEEVMDEIITAGQYAPSGMGKQDTAFLAVQDKELRDTLSRLNADVMRKMMPDYNGDPFYGAPVVIAVLADPKSFTHVQDGSVAMENLLLAATDAGLGSCWVHRGKEVFASDEGKAILKANDIPEDYEGIGFAIMGYPAGDAPEAAPRKSIVRKVL